MTPCAKLGPAISLLLLVCTFNYAIATLTQGEVDALSQILENYPDLTSVPSWASTDEYGQYYGSSWNTSFTTLCQTDGYSFYGVYCLDGQIAALLEYESSSVAFQTILRCDINLT